MPFDTVPFDTVPHDTVAFGILSIATFRAHSERMPTGSAGTLHSIDDCDGALYRLLKATLRTEMLVARRDSEVATIQKQYATQIAKSGIDTASLEAEIEAYYDAHRDELERDGKKSVQLANGTLGMRAPSNPPLVPLNAKWNWEKIEAKLKELWSKKYFHKPKPPGIDKVKAKKDLTEEQLKECGLKLDATEKFYYELNRLAIPDAAILPDEAAKAA
jgi:hypothetical protein